MSSSWQSDQLAWSPLVSGSRCMQQTRSSRAPQLAAHVVCDVCAVRKAKAEATFPRPTAGALRPIVHGQTLRYQAKRRSGRGFTHEELKV